MTVRRVFLFATIATFVLAMTRCERSHNDDDGLQPPREGLGTWALLVGLGLVGTAVTLTLGSRMGTIERELVDAQPVLWATIEDFETTDTVNQRGGQTVRLTLRLSRDEQISQFVVVYALQAKLVERGARLAVRRDPLNDGPLLIDWQRSEKGPPLES